MQLVTPVPPPLHRMWRHNMSLLFTPLYGHPQIKFMAITIQYYSSRLQTTPLMFLKKEKREPTWFTREEDALLILRDCYTQGNTGYRFSTIPKGTKQYSFHVQKVYPTVFPFVNKNQGKENGNKQRIEREAGENHSQEVPQENGKIRISVTNATSFCPYLCGI